MEKTEYIDRKDVEKWLLTETASLDREEDRQCVVERLREDISASNVVPWSWLEQLIQSVYMPDMPAKQFIKYARKEWENGTADKL